MGRRGQRPRSSISTPKTTTSSRVSAAATTRAIRSSSAISKIALRIVPSGALRPNAELFIGGGTVVSLAGLLDRTRYAGGDRHRYRAREDLRSRARRVSVSRDARPRRRDARAARPPSARPVAASGRPTSIESRASGSCSAICVGREALAEQDSHGAVAHGAAARGEEDGCRAKRISSPRRWRRAALLAARRRRRRLHS